MSSQRNGPSLSNRIAGHRVSHDVTSRAVFDFMHSLDCPRSLAIWLMYESREFDQLVEMDFNIQDYCSLDDSRDAYLATEFLAKYKDFVLTRDKEALALAKFKEYELRCKRLNSEFRSYRAQNWKNSGLGPLLSAMAFKIDKILGPLPVQEIFDSCNWGPGASTTISRRRASSPHKFQYETGITRRLYEVLCPDGQMTILSGYSQRWCNRLIEEGFPLFESGNKVVTVPKSSKIDRVIAIEPGFNIWFQKGVGAVMKRRLRRRGIDLTDQSSNQRLSRFASESGALATIDFSSASDSIAYELVKEVFPPSWFALLNRLRCDRGVLQGETFTWEKFSSMGNGCTFEIETLLFVTLAYACADMRGIGYEGISVYGDDVIIPVAIADIFQHYSERLGFSFNSKKSHATSYFRESCGAHWYAGVDLKPVYLKGRLRTVQSVYRLANAIRRLAHRQWNYSACDSRFRLAFYHLVYSIPKAFRLQIPDKFGDGGFIVNFDEASPRSASTRFPFYEGYLVSQVVDVSIDAKADYDGVLLTHLKAIENFEPTRILVREPDKLTAPQLSTQSAGNNLPTKTLTRTVVMTSLVAQWYNLGPWL